MNRLLLTLLALLTGLVAQASSPQPVLRAPGETGIEAIEAGQPVRAAAAVAVMGQRLETSHAAPEREHGGSLSLRVTLPTVLIGIDRARE